MTIFNARKTCATCAYDKTVSVEILAQNPKLTDLTSDKKLLGGIKFSSHPHPTKVDYKLQTGMLATLGKG